ncbi:MAG: alkyl hydroperoxide reductase [Legionellales bacterium RIFCSPHIGHO2_12_FULL_42_9]|nr:MAG: alkyl hydroperoxide reductase [Legionellales bacterium RIFCSPHIGHO2_12_FULL_42_9]
MTVLVARLAPDFTVPAVLASGEIIDKFNLHSTLKGKYGLIFFYPLDFTFVCPSELIALDHRIQEFKDRHVEVIAVSIDSQFTHNAYRNMPVKQGGIGPVKFTLAADVTHSICQSYGVEHPAAGVALRGAFIIDKNAIVRSQIVNDLPIGRDVDELLRTIDAIQFFDENGEVCPAGWHKGQAGMKASPKGVADYLATHSEEL